MTEPTKTHPFLEAYFQKKSLEELLKAQSGDAQSIKSIIDGMDKMMKIYAKKISYTQIRNILQLVKQEEYEKDLGHFYKVLPLLAYTEARLSPKDEGRKVISFIRELAGSVQDGQYSAFIDIMNTIVAYHKLNS